MKNINPYFLRVPLYPITGLADDDEAVTRYWDTDLNDELQARSIIKTLLVPEMSERGPKVRDQVQLAFKYYLSRDETDWARIYDAVLPPFETPSDARLFMYWVYEECFQTSDYNLPNIENYVQNRDVDEPLSVIVEEKNEKSQE